MDKIIEVKVVVNKCYGSFSLSEEAKELYIKRKGLKLQRYISENNHYRYFSSFDINHLNCFTQSFYSFILDEKEINNSKDLKIFSFDNIPRNDTDLIYVIETLGNEKASGEFADLQIETVEIVIHDYDGLETIN